MFSIDYIKSLAKQHRGKVGIGIADKTYDFMKSQIENAKEYAEIIPFTNPTELVLHLKKDEINAVVRGTLDSKPVLRELKIQFGVSVLLRVAILSTAKDKLFLFGPVGIDECESLSEKMTLIEWGSRLIQKFKDEPRIGILSGGRLDDKGRSECIDKSLRDGELLTKFAKSRRFVAEHYGIQIENAIENCNFIVAPDGISGNLVFRTLYYLGGGNSFGAPLLNIDKVYVDTSRNKKSYVDSIIVASALASFIHSPTS